MPTTPPPTRIWDAWACGHFHGTTNRSVLSASDYPLTWEQDASKANYNGLKRIDPALAGHKIAGPHAWHAAEAFLRVVGLGAHGLA